MVRLSFIATTQFQFTGAPNRSPMADSIAPPNYRHPLSKSLAGSSLLRPRTSNHPDQPPIAKATTASASAQSSSASLTYSQLIEDHDDARHPAQTYEHVLDCVLKVFCTHCEPNYTLPWALTPQRTSTSTAFILSDRQILTNAHSVEHHTSVKLKRRDSDTKYTATVVAIGNECDIALLRVDDESFWESYENSPPLLHDDADAVDVDAGADADVDADVHADNGASTDVNADDGTTTDASVDNGARTDADVSASAEADDRPFSPFLIPGPLPHLQDPVLVVGYPSPGNQISVTAGVSSRVEMQQYVHGQGELLTVQIDAAINPGNSGGPVINERNQVVGIAFQSIDPSQADSVGYFIPFCIVKHFLDDIATHKRYTGFPYCGFRWQKMENPCLRNAKKMESSQSGVLIKWVAETSDASNKLRRGDVITHIDHVSISNSGTVPFRAGERIGLEFLVTSKFSNDAINVSFLRDGEEHNENYLLSSMENHRLVPVHDARHLVRRQPEYVVFGGLVFQSLSEPFLRAAYGCRWLADCPVRLLDEYYRGTRTKSGKKEIILLAQILASECNSGYEQEEGDDIVILNKVNGTLVQSLKHLASLIDECPADENICFELDGDAVIILDKKEALGEQESILFTHCIPAERSLSKPETSTVANPDSKIR